MPATQTSPYLSHEIQYTRNITRELVERHKEAWREKGKQLVSAILFGPLADGEYDEYINLLEVVKGYPAGGGAMTHEFPSTSQFPMYGRLRLRIMNPEEFKKAVAANAPLIENLREQKEFLFDQRQFAEKLLT
jgi:hypothetical protein